MWSPRSLRLRSGQAGQAEWARCFSRERFRREALAAASLDHPFICKVFEIGDADGPSTPGADGVAVRSGRGRLFIVMEYVAGETLHAMLGRGPLSSAALLTLAIELTEALEAAHARQIVHRDLKPANIMLTSQHHAKVMDFGLAKLVPDASADTRLGAGAPITEQGVGVGTPAYMSPEQVAGDTVDHRSDIFSLGVVLIEAVTGVHPFRRGTMAGTMTAVLNDPPLVHAAAAVGEMHPSLRSILLRMLMKSPDARSPVWVGLGRRSTPARTRRRCGRNSGATNAMRRASLRCASN